MQILDILYVILSIAIVVLTIALVWLINDLVKLSRSLRRSTDDVAIMTKEVKEKVLLVTEVMDRMGTLASHFIGIIEEAETQIREKSGRIVAGLGTVLGVSDLIKKHKAKAKPEIEEDESDEEEAEESETEEKTNEPEEKTTKPTKGTKEELSGDKETKIDEDKKGEKK